MLAKSGWRIAMIDNKSLDSPATSDNRSIVLSFSTQQILNALNLWPLLASQAYPICKIHVSNAGHFGAIRFDAKEIDIPVFGYVVPASLLTQALQQALLSLVETKKIDLICPAEIKKISKDTVTLQKDNQTQLLNTKLLVAADGTNSKIRQLLRIETENYDYQQTAIIAKVQLQQDHQQVAYERLTSTGPLAILPRENYQAGLVWTVASDEVKKFLTYSDEEFLQQLQRSFGYRLGKFQAVSQRTIYPLQLVHAKKQIHPGAVLLGNAAHTLHPLAGQGFNLGLRDAATLAEILLDAKAIDQSLHDYDILKKYQTWREQDQKNIIHFTDRTVRLFTHDFFKPFYGAGLVGIDVLPFLKRRLTRRLLGLSGKTPKLVCGVEL